VANEARQNRKESLSDAEYILMVSLFLAICSLPLTDRRREHQRDQRSAGPYLSVDTE
jgi:hypothetical protein